MVDHRIRPKNLPYFGGPSPNCWPTPGGPAKAAPDPGGQSHYSEATHLGSSVWWPKLLPPQCFLQSSGHAKCGPHAGGELWAVSLGWIDFLEQILSVCFCATKSRHNDFKWLTSILSIFFGCAFGWQKWRQKQVSFGVSRPRTALTSRISWRTRAVTSKIPPRRWSICPAASPAMRCVRRRRRRSSRNTCGVCRGWESTMPFRVRTWVGCDFHDRDDLLNSRNGEACSLFVFGMFTTEYQSQVQPKFRSL